MIDLLLAILMTINSLLTPSATPTDPFSDEKRVQKAKYILENNLYKVNDGGVIIDPLVSL